MVSSVHTQAVLKYFTNIKRQNKRYNIVLNMFLYNVFKGGFVYVAIHSDMFITLVAYSNSVQIC